MENQADYIPATGELKVSRTLQEYLSSKMKILKLEL